MASIKSRTTRAMEELVGEKLKRTLPEDLQAFIGCKRRSYPHPRSREQKGNGRCETRRIQRPDGSIQWECRTCSNVEEPQLSQPAHKDDAQAGTTIKMAEQGSENLQSQAINSEENSYRWGSLMPSMTSHSDSDLESTQMTYYTDSDSDLVPEPSKYSVASAADKTALGNNEAHETAHSTDVNTSVDESPTDAELSACKEMTDSRHQPQPVAGTSFLIDKRDQTQETSNVRERLASAQIEALSQAATGPIMVFNNPGIGRVSEHFQQLGTFPPSYQFEPPGRVEGTQSFRRTPLAQPSEETNADNGTGQEATSSQPSNIVVHISSDAYTKEQIVSPLHPSLKRADPAQSSFELLNDCQWPGTAISIPTRNPPPVLEPRLVSFATLMLQKLVPPPSATPPAYTLRPSTLLTLTPRPHPPSTHTTNDNPQTSVIETGIGGGSSTKNSSLPFQKRFNSLLIRLTKIGAAPSLSGRDPITTVPSLEHLDDEIINEYLKFLVHYTNARTQRDKPNTCKQIAMIGSTDVILHNFLKGLATFSKIFVPIKVRHQCPTDVPPQWVLAVLYPPTLEQTQGRAEIYDSHEHWIKNVMTASNVLQFLKSRLEDEFNPADWTLISQQFSQPQQNEADSGLFVVANAKSIALGLRMVCLDSDRRSMSLRRQIAGELATRSIVEGHFRAPKKKSTTGVTTITRPRTAQLRHLRSKGD